jgi:hypothetical protein
LDQYRTCAENNKTPKKTEKDPGRSELASQRNVRALDELAGKRRRGKRERAREQRASERGKVAGAAWQRVNARGASKARQLAGVVRAARGKSRGRRLSKARARRAMPAQEPWGELGLAS